MNSKQQKEFIKLLKHNPFEITGCVFSSVLSSSENLKPTIGFVQLNESVKHYETLISKGFQAADISEGVLVTNKSGQLSTTNSTINKS
ncbi:hypothetical protein PN36_00400 [Candidatus Thiomargarita nelsonii]|uniref:Uncharacterized protein n=1 Tax=Candidatus Thiomargarita nelsonii TaxID=1003181 RepID=A0A0A6P4G0_9GAMM|nr:hypothetical protein PN36_00400 [Candidatus Thiomargarita nelsonii]